MQKLNPSPLVCIYHSCNTIPTIVLEFRDGHKVLGQIITCREHQKEGITMGTERYRRSSLKESYYPEWLQKLHKGVMLTGFAEGKPVDPKDVERLQTFLESSRGRSAERR